MLNNIQPTSENETEHTVMVKQVTIHNYDGPPRNNTGELSFQMIGEKYNWNWKSIRVLETRSILKPAVNSTRDLLDQSIEDASEGLSAVSIKVTAAGLVAVGQRLPTVEELERVHWYRDNIFNTEELFPAAQKALQGKPTQFMPESRAMEVITAYFHIEVERQKRMQTISLATAMRTAHSSKQ